MQSNINIHKFNNLRIDWNLEDKKLQRFLLASVRLSSLWVSAIGHLECTKWKSLQTSLAY
ncbi:hypothetical protein SLEP1_g32077 [Rubroshorea leprosula]|uniref:Uncharacterized protein n=1 Tax=Rubroshorea leprosula TaxID=152421 RepID=A0AAV5KC63_9ROSI|nr:hypothetical protein SLEP1_g32077 [Rubroshorea leprosula]